ncbi:MAG: WD40 repeat domain-containing protein [Muribaculaceae bacterium]|nr:WD40 repeat domain-containing protein [Muribaculaceae bacterium]
MRKNSALIALTVLAAFGVSSTFGAYAKEEHHAPATRNVYVFKNANAISRVEPYNTTVYGAGINTVTTLRGEVLSATGKNAIEDFRINPAGISYAVVTSGKGGNKAAVYNSIEVDDRLFQFNVKKYGEPTAVCFTPDARVLLVAAGDKIYMLDTRKYIVFGAIENVPFQPTAMIMSPNGYYLAIVGGDKVAVYNYENKTIRKELSLGEKVNEVAFSPESTDFGVLTADGILSLYNTRTFDLRKMIDDLGEGKAFAFNFDGKYVAVNDASGDIVIVNLLRDSDREHIAIENGSVSDVCFVTDFNNNTLMCYPSTGAVELRRMPNLKPFYNKLIADQVDEKMDEWLKMMPGETMEQYSARVTDESRRRQRQLFEDEISTNFAGDLLDGMGMSLGSYDRSNGVLALNFESMPSIYVPVPESDITEFNNASDIELSDVQYGIMPDDSFEIVYAKITNIPTGKSYIYDNHNRASMDHMNSEDAISIELLQQQQMEEVKLQELRAKVVDEAKSENVISDHTNIAVNSKMVPDYDADGNKILNYNVSFTYNVEPEFSAVEDFGPGKYHVEESGAASSMLKIVKQAFEGDFKQYIASGKKVRVALRGTADASPIVRGIPYDGVYGDIDNEPVYKDGQLSTISVNTKNGIKENDQLALLRAMGVKNFLENNVEGYKDMNVDYRYDVNVSKDKGSEFRRITVDFTFVDAY